MQRPETLAPGLQPSGGDHGEPVDTMVSAQRNDSHHPVSSPRWPRLSGSRHSAPSPADQAETESPPAPAAPQRAHASPVPEQLLQQSTSTSRRHPSSSPPPAPSHTSSSLQTAKGHVPVPRDGSREKEESSEDEDYHSDDHTGNVHHVPDQAGSQAHAGTWGTSDGSRA